MIVKIPEFYYSKLLIDKILTICYYNIIYFVLMEVKMEPIELSVNEQLELFVAAAQNMSPNTNLWHKGADLCLLYDVEKQNDTTNGSKLMGYLYKTIHDENAKWLGLELKPIIAYTDEAIQKNVFKPRDKTYLLTEIVKSEALLYRDDLNLLLSQSSVRQAIQNEFNEADPQRKEADEGLKRAYARLRNYEHTQILKEGNEFWDMDKPLRKVLGKKMAKAVRSGIAPSKDVTSKLLHEDQITKDTLMQARMIAKNVNTDKLAQRQKNLEDKGFIRKIVNRRKQQGA